MVCETLDPIGEDTEECPPRRHILFLGHCWEGRTLSLKTVSSRRTHSPLQIVCPPACLPITQAVIDSVLHCHLSCSPRVPHLVDSGYFPFEVCFALSDCSISEIYLMTLIFKMPVILISCSRKTFSFFLHLSVETLDRFITHCQGTRRQIR